jgi:serine/threonine protein kinase
MGCKNSTGVLKADSFHRSYRLGEKLGEGNFGEVRLAKLRALREARAVKIIGACAASEGRNNDPFLGAKSEADAMQLVRGHDNCVMLFETFLERSAFYLVMERCHSSLISHLDQRVQVSEEYMSRIFREMLSGIAHVHTVNLVHRDIKPENFVYGGQFGRTVKLGDFGMAQLLPEKGYLTSHCGTAPYMSPEIVSHRRYGFKTDVWSMGVTAYMLLYRDFPYVPETSTVENMKKCIRIGERAPTHIPADKNVPVPSECARSFVMSLMVRKASERCSAKEALQLPFVCSHNDSSHGDLTPMSSKMEESAPSVQNKPIEALAPTVTANPDELPNVFQARVAACFSEPCYETQSSRASSCNTLAKFRSSHTSLSTRASIESQSSSRTFCGEGSGDGLECFEISES